MTAPLRLAYVLEEARQSLVSKAQPRSEVDAARRLSRRLQSVLDQASTGVLDELERLGRVPSNDLTRKQIERIFLDRADELGADIVDDALEAANRGRRKAVDALRKKGVSGISFDELPTGVANRIRDHAFQASRSTLSRLAGDVMGTLTEAYSDGLGIADAAELLRDQFTNMRDHELVRIARTETQAFQNEGAFETERELGVRYHEWVSANDERTRESHLEVHGEIVPVGELFSNGLKYPLDRDGTPIEEWVNCRCRAAPFIVPSDKKAPGWHPFREGDLEERVKVRS